MHITKLPITDQIFTHIDEHTGANTTLAASALRRWCEFAKHEIVLVPITAKGADLCRTKRGLERPRLLAAVQTPPRELKPLLFAEWGDGTQLLIDGSHTYVAHYIRKWQFAKAWLVPKHIWNPRFVIEGLPEVSEHELLLSHSKLPPFQKRNSP